jgi:hypothetical protein
VGIVAVTIGRREAVGLGLCSIVAIALGGCRFTGDLFSAAAGGAAGSASANPVVGFAVAVGVHSAIDATVSYALRKRQQAEQDAIAAVVGPLGVGEMRPWAIRHDIPIGNEHGDVEVTRLIATPLALCKEIVFSVVEGTEPTAQRAWYATNACQEGEKWKWAAAEPTTARRGFLQ